MCPCCEALRVAADRSRLRITNVASFNKVAAHHAVGIRARNAVVHENEPNCPLKPVGVGSLNGTHIPHPSVPAENGDPE